MPTPNHRTIPSQSLNNSLHLKPVKKNKKVVIKLPKSDDRRVVAANVEAEQLCAPPNISTIPNYTTTNLHQSTDDNIIDIYLPGKDAWDAIKQRAITNQLYKLGIHTTPTPSEQKYDVNFDAPANPSNHSKSMSFGSDLLDFKMDKFFNNSGVDNKSPNLSNKHSSSLSLSNFNTTNLSSALSSPSSYFPHSPLSPSTGHLNIPDTSGPPSNASHNPSSLPDVEEEDEEEDDKFENKQSVQQEQQNQYQNKQDEEEVDKQLNHNPQDTSPNTSIIPDEAPQLPPPSFQELSRGFGYELDYEEEQAQLAQLAEEEKKHKKSFSGFTVKSANQYEDGEGVEDADVDAVEDIVKPDSLDDPHTTDTNTNTNTDTEDHAFNYELQKREGEHAKKNDQEQENTIKPATALNSALKPTVAEFIPSIPFKDSTNNYNSSSFKFGMQQPSPAQYDVAPTQPVEIPTNKRQRASSRATSGDGDNWSGFDVNSDGGDLDTFSDPSDEERVLQRRFNNRMMSNNAFQFGGMEGVPSYPPSAPLNRKTSLSANAPAFEPNNFTFKSELSMIRSVPTDSALQRTESKESDMPYKRGRPNPSNAEDDWTLPFTSKQEAVDEDVYDIHDEVQHSEKESDSRNNFSLQDVYYKLEQLSINLKARDVLTSEDLNSAIESDRGVILEGLDRLDHASQHASSMNRLTLLADLLAGLKPQIATLKPDEHTLAAKVSEAVTPGIQLLVDLASDKKETATLITEHLTNSDMFTSITTTLSDMLNRHCELYDSFHATQAEIFTNASSLQAKLGDLPSGITDATTALQAATAKLNSYASLPAELTQMREYVCENSELRNEISKAQSLHGKLRSEKDRLLDKMRVIEEERDSAKMEADLSRQSSRKVESDLVKIEATNGSLIESLSGMSNKCAQFEHQLADLLDQKQTWYAADRDYQVRVKELEMQLDMQGREHEHELRAREEDRRRMHAHTEEMGRVVQSSRIEYERLHGEYENMSRSSLAVNQDLMARNTVLESRNAELEAVAREAEEHAYAQHASGIHVHELEEKGAQDRVLLEEATNTIERLYQEMSATNHENSELRRENEGLIFSRGVDVDDEGRCTPTNKLNGVDTSRHAPAPAFNTPVSPAYSSISKLSTSTAATYQADDGWFYAT